MNSIFNNTYKGKKVLLTGHTGFKGSWVAQWLLELGADVCGYSLNPPTEINLFDKLNISNEINHNISDIRDYDSLIKVFKEFKPDIVFHLAAQPLVRESYITPIDTFQTNVIGTANVLEAIRYCDSVKAGVIITTDKCYENKEWVYGYRENDPMGGHDPYSASKGCAELVTSSYRNSFFNVDKFGDSHNVTIASTRAGNVIGGGDWAVDRLVPDCIRALTKNETIIIRNPISTRPWQHVLEPLSGYLWLGAKMLEDGKKYSEAWNFGPNDEDVLTVEELVKNVIKYWGNGEYKIVSDKIYHEANLLKLDISKAFFKLNWKPVYKANNAIKKSIEWYKNYYQGSQDIKSLTIKQINEYINDAKELKIEWSVK
ncbi:MAG: CDP-glucose 4,6-dehydratase [Candidatus Sericytochromatia bacterium]